MVNEVLTLGPLTIQKSSEEHFESYTSSNAKSVRKLTPFHVGGERQQIAIDELVDLLQFCGVTEEKIKIVESK